MASDAKVPSARVEFESAFGELAEEWKAQQSELASQVSYEDAQPWSFSADGWFVRGFMLGVLLARVVAWL
jgi:hypothetical protein